MRGSIPTGCPPTVNNVPWHINDHIRAYTHGNIKSHIFIMTYEWYKVMAITVLNFEVN